MGPHEALEPDTVVVRCPEVLGARAEGELVLLHRALRSCHALDDEGRAVWELIDGRRTLGEACALWAAQRNCDHELCWRQLSAFVRVLLERRLIECVAT